MCNKVSKYMETESIAKTVFNHLLHLKDLYDKSLIYRKRKTFIIGFVSTKKSIISATKELLRVHCQVGWPDSFKML